MKIYLFNLGFLLLTNCGKTITQVPYNLNKPDRTYTLPAVLDEISGITVLDADRLGIVQDEVGKVFIFDLKSGKVINEFPFDGVGDFEGLTNTGSALYALRSDGRLTEWKNFNASTGTGDIRHQPLKLQTKDNEGLCYDAANSRLLIAGKSKPVDPGAKSERYIYAYDLKSQQLASAPLYKINIMELELSATKFGVRQGNLFGKDKPKPFDFRPSSLAIHPGSRQLYILSAADNLLVVLDTKGKVVDMIGLNPSLFTKAEGITFLNDGTMLISNEADGGVATILKYAMRS